MAEHAKIHLDLTNALVVQVGKEETATLVDNFVF